MKLTINARSAWTSAKKTTLKVGQGNVFASTEFGGQVVVPLTLMATRGNDGKMRPPFVAVGQPAFTNKDGQRRISYFSVHLDNEAAKAVEEMVTPEFMKAEVKRLIGSDKFGDYEWQDGKWIHIQDRVATGNSNPEDEDLMAKALGNADEMLAKSEAARAKEQAESQVSQSEAASSAQNAVDALS